MLWPEKKRKEKKAIFAVMKNILSVNEEKGNQCWELEKCFGKGNQVPEEGFNSSMVWSTHRTFSEGHSNCIMWVLLLRVLVSNLPSILATTFWHKSSHSSNLLSLRSPCCHDVPLAKTYFQRLQRGSVCLGFDRRKAAGAESPRSSSCAVHLLPMWTQTQENWSVTWYACSVELVDWLIAKPELGTWPGL